MSERVSDLDKIKTLGACAPPCVERLMAVIDGEFGPARILGGWIFRDGPYRRLDDTAKWKAVYYDQDAPTDHTGEPYPPAPDDEGLESDTDDCC